MLVREILQSSHAGPEARRDRTSHARLPTSLKAERSAVRTVMQQGLAASRLFARGDRAGVLRAAQRRSGRAFRLDVRQRVVVKALVSKHSGHGTARGGALLAHVAYLGRSGAGADGSSAAFFDQARDEVHGASVAANWAADRHHFRFIISPEHGERIQDLRAFTREVLHRVLRDLGQPELEWLATCHFDTDQPHAHVLLRGRKANGRDLVIPRDYIAYGFRARAQEVAQELLGDLSRANAERRIWRETQADRFTGFDRRLLLAADQDRLVDDGVGVNDAWSALTRGRLRHLEALGLSERVGRRYRLKPELETSLRALHLRQDIIRTLHQRQLRSGQEVIELGPAGVRGRVIERGHHDELGGASWVVVRDGRGVEHYARLALGQTAPPVGRSVEVWPGTRGASLAASGRGAEL